MRIVAQRAEHGRSLASHGRGVARHHGEIGVDEGCEIGLVDDEQVGGRDARTPLARHLVASRDVEHEDLPVHERAREDRRQVVAPALDEHEVERTLLALEALDRVQVRRDVVADCSVRATARLDRGDEAVGEHRVAPEEVRIFGRVDVVRDDADAYVIAEGAAQRGDERRLAAAHGPADADAERSRLGARTGRPVRVDLAVRVIVVRVVVRRQRAAPPRARGARRQARNAPRRAREGC